VTVKRGDVARQADVIATAAVEYLLACHKLGADSAIPAYSATQARVIREARKLARLAADLEPGDDPKDWRELDVAS
jgi:hypothetical protein